jgi:hypothetical protein
MSTDKTKYMETQTLDRIFNNTTPDGSVDGCYVALWSTVPSNTPNNTNEISASGYSPQQVTASGWTNTQSGGPRKFENANIIDFGVLDSSSTTTVDGVVLYDGSDTSTANALYADSLVDGGGSDVTKTVSSGNEFKFNSGDLTVSED